MLDTSIDVLADAVKIKAEKGLSFATVKRDLEDSYGLVWADFKDSCPDIAQQLKDLHRRYMAEGEILGIMSQYF